MKRLHLATLLSFLALALTVFSPVQFALAAFSPHSGSTVSPQPSPTPSFVAPTPPRVDDLALVATSVSGNDKEFVFTNKQTAYYSGNVAKLNTRHWHGLVVRHAKYVENFYLKLGDPSSEQVLDEDAFVGARVFPHYLERTYDLGGVYHPREKIFVPDQRDGLVVSYSTGYSGSAVLYVQFDVHDVYGSPGSYSYGWSSQYGCLWVTNDATGEYVVVKTNASSPSFVASEYWPSKTYPLDQARGESGVATVFQPGYLQVTIGADGRAFFAFGVANTLSGASAVADELLANFDALLDLKAGRLDQLLAKTPLVTGNPEFNRAIAWAKCSLDALVMQQEVGGVPVGPGIWAGLHWFPESWSRDLFISFPGATLVTGQFDLASELIDMMAGLQDEDPGSVTYGRVPNRLLPGDPSPAYSSADGTPWFLRELYEYVRYSGDLGFLEDNWDVVQRAVDGAFEKRGDENGFVKHGPGVTGHLVETWMDGAVWVGSTLVANSPREDRAVEIQALWHAATWAAVELAELTGHVDDANRWSQHLQTLAENFPKFYYNETLGYLFDHLNPDDSPDARIRPNQLFAISVPFVPLLDDQQESSVLDVVTRELLFPHGVATLNKGDVNNWGTEDVGYRGYDYGGLSDASCFKDPDGHWVGNSWSYHNGMVWPWLSGPATTALVKHGRLDDAYALTSFLTTLLLDRGCLGSLCEVLPGDEDRPTGTTSQAWSLAEYLRVAYQDYLGFRPEASRRRLWLEPVVPDELGNVTAVVLAGEGQLGVSVERSVDGNGAEFVKVVVDPTDLAGYELRVAFRTAGEDADQTPTFYLNGQPVGAAASREPYGTAWNVTLTVTGDAPFELMMVVGESAPGGGPSGGLRVAGEPSLLQVAAAAGLAAFATSLVGFVVVVVATRSRKAPPPPKKFATLEHFEAYLRRAGLSTPRVESLRERLGLREPADALALASLAKQDGKPLLEYLEESFPEREE